MTVVVRYTLDCVAVAVARTRSGGTSLVPLERSCDKRLCPLLEILRRNLGVLQRPRSAAIVRGASGRECASRACVGAPALSVMCKEGWADCARVAPHSPSCGRRGSLYFARTEVAGPSAARAAQVGKSVREWGGGTNVARTLLLPSEEHCPTPFICSASRRNTLSPSPPASRPGRGTGYIFAASSL